MSPATIDIRPIGELQRETLYRLANLTAWPASAFDAWLSDTFGVSSLARVTTWDLAAAVIRALRDITPPAGPSSDLPARPPSVRRPAARPDRPPRPQSAEAFFGRPPNTDPEAAASTAATPEPV